MEGSFSSKPSVCFEVEKVIGVSSDGTYRVQWSPSWVSKFQLVGCEHLIQEYLQRKAEKEESDNVQQQGEKENNVYSLQQKAEKEESDNIHQQGETENNDLVQYQLVEDKKSDILPEIPCRRSRSNTDHVPLQKCPYIVYPSNVVDESSVINQPDDDMNSEKAVPYKNYLKLNPLDDYGFQYEEDGDISNELEENLEFNPDLLDIKIEEETDDAEPEFMFLVCDQQNGRMEHAVLKSQASCTPANDHPPNKSFVCPLCRKQFPHKVVLREHFRIHSGYKPFLCPHCKTSFSRNVNLKRHLSTHKNENLHHCSHCDKAFSRKGDMERHLRLVKGEKSYMCEVCGKSFGRLYHLNRHLLIHTGEKSFSCTLCNKSFATKCYLDDHLRGHEGFRPYACNVCKKTFAKMPTLAKHKLTHNTEEENNFIWDVQGYP